MDDELKDRFAASEVTPSAPVDPGAVRHLARQRRSRRRMAGSGLAAVFLIGGLIAWGGPDRPETRVEVLTPPPSSSTTTTAFDPFWVPGSTYQFERDVDWADAPEPCAEPGTYALRADLVGNGSEAYITDVEDPSTQADEVPSRLLRVCDSDEVWDYEVGHIQLMSTVRVGDRWFIGSGGTSGAARFQGLLTLVDGHLVEVVEEHGQPVRLVEGNVADDSPQIRNWWGCEEDSLVTAIRESGSNEWHLIHYRWDEGTGQMVTHLSEVRRSTSTATEPSTYGEGIQHLAEVLPTACPGSDDWGRGGVPRWTNDNGEPRWLGWPSIPEGADH